MRHLNPAHLMEKINKLSLPATILLGCIVLGGFYFASQMVKQNSIERQAQIDREAKSFQQTLDNAKEEISLKQKECESLSVGVARKWNNVMGVTYDEKLWKECVVTFTDTKTGEIQVLPLRLMQTAK